MESLLGLLEVELNSVLEFRDVTFDQISKVMMSLGDWKRSVEKSETMKTNFLEQARKLALQEKKLVEDSDLLRQREKEVEVKIKRFKECCDEFERKDKELELIKIRIQGSSVEFNLREEKLNECDKELSSKKQELHECTKELSLKRQELGSVNVELDECNNKILLKKEDLSEVQKSLEKRTAELETTIRNLGLVEEKFHISLEKLELVKKSLQEHSKKLEHKEKDLQEVENLININQIELESNEQKLRELHNLITSSSVEINLRREELEGARNSIKDCEKDLDLTRKEHEYFQTLTENSKKEFGFLQKKLSRIHNLMEERSKELNSKELELYSINQLIEEYDEELKVKEKQHDILNSSVHQCYMKLKWKEKELELTEKSLKKNLEKLHAEDETLDSIEKSRENEEKKLSSLKESIKYDINLKGLELDAIQKSILERQKELELEEELLKSIKSTIEENVAELILMSEQRMLIQKSITDCSKELESKQQSLDSMRKCLEECCSEVSIKDVQQSVIQIVCCEYLRELQEEKTYFDSLNRTMEERVRELRKEETQLEGNVVKLNSMKQKFYFRQETSEGRQGEVHQEGRQTSTILPSSQNIGQCSSSLISLSPVLQCCIIGDGSKLQMLLNEQFRKNDLIHFQIFELLQISPDPAKLVLDAMQGFYPAGLNNEHMGFDLDVIRKSCVTLLEQVVKISPQIKPHVRDEAMKLAMEWKEKMKPGHENSLEALAFLKLLAVYKLNYAFSVDELRNLLKVVECEQKHDLHEALGNGIRHGDIELAEYSDGNPLCSSFANSHSNPTTSVRSPELLFNDVVVDQDLSIDEVRDGIQFSPDPAKLVLDVLQGSFFQFWNKGSSGFSTHLMRNVVVLLEQLMNSSPKVSRQVKETALQQVLLWKDNISTETQNSFEVLAFLMFLAVYDLVSYFKRDEILVLVETIIHHKQAPEICRTLGFTNEIAGLTMNLIQRKQFLEAARFSHAFELSVKFLPVTILTSYLQNTMNDGGLSSNGNNSFEDQFNIIEKKAIALREFVECVADCKLEQIFPREVYMHYIAELQGKKTRLAQLFPAYPSMAQQSLQSHMAQQSTQLMQTRNLHMVGASSSSYQQFCGPRKRSRLDTIVLESYQGSTATRFNYPSGDFPASN